MRRYGQPILDISAPDVSHSYAVRNISDTQGLTSCVEYSQACQAGGANVGTLTVTAGGAAATTASAAVTTPIILTSASVTTPVVISPTTTIPVIVTTPVTTPAATTTAPVLSALPSVTAAASGAGQVKVVGAGVLATVFAAVVALL